MSANLGMNDAILIAYAARDDLMVKVAEALAYEIGQYCGLVDVAPVQRVRDVRPYRAVILGSVVRHARWLPEAIAFLSAQRSILRFRLVGCFQVCAAQCYDPSENPDAARYAFEDIRRAFPEFRPLQVGMFNGEVTTAIQTGDWRELDSVRAWGQKMGKVLFEMLQPRPERQPPEAL